jgi:hypothetical protein
MAARIEAINHKIPAIQMLDVIKAMVEHESKWSLGVPLRRSPPAADLLSFQKPCAVTETSYQNDQKWILREDLNLFPSIPRFTYLGTSLNSRLYCLKKSPRVQWRTFRDHIYSSLEMTQFLVASGVEGRLSSLGWNAKCLFCAPSLRRSRPRFRRALPSPVRHCLRCRFSPRSCRVWPTGGGVGPGRIRLNPRRIH